MMTQIKHALAFVWGAAYVASLQALFTYWGIVESGLAALGMVGLGIFAAASTLFVGALVLIFLVENWGEE